MAEIIKKTRTYLEGKKTYIVGAVSILGVVVAWVNYTISTQDAIQTIVTAILAMTVRAGVSKV